MPNMRNGWLKWLLGFPMLAVSVAYATVVPMDLRTFAADPVAAVLIEDDGTSATLREDPGFADVLLWRDFLLADPIVSLIFDYAFSEAVGETDEFGAFLIDVGTGEILGEDYRFFVQDSGRGQVRFDLSALIGQRVGLQFQLSSLDESGSSSMVRVTDPRFAFESVPEPATLVLVAVGLFGLSRISRAPRGSGGSLRIHGRPPFQRDSVS